jgi:Bacteriophage probable baseplate hub protein
MPRSDVPDVDVRIDGTSFPGRDLRSVTVLEDLDAPSMFSLRLYNWDDERQRVSWSDSSRLAIGGQVDIAMGHVDDLHPVMTGEITSLEPTFTKDEPPMLTVRGYDYRHRLARGRKTRAFQNMKNSQIALQVAREAGLTARAKDTATVLPHVLQCNQSDWEFLRQRARLSGYEAFVRKKTLYFQPAPDAGSAAVTLSLDRDITEFSPRLSALGQLDELTVRGWDMRKKAPIVGTARSGRPQMGGSASGSAAASRAFRRASAAGLGLPIGSTAEADQAARGAFDDLALRYVQGSVVCTGQPLVRAGSLVTVEGAGRTFSGRYYVSSVTHTISPDRGYETTLAVQRSSA